MGLTKMIQYATIFKSVEISKAIYWQSNSFHHSIKHNDIVFCHALEPRDHDQLKFVNVQNLCEVVVTYRLKSAFNFELKEDERTTVQAA